MRKILSLMRDYRIQQLKESKAPETRFAEVSQMFGWLDGALSGVRLNQYGGTDMPETRLQEVMTSADFTYAIQEFVQRQMVPGYTQKTFNFEPFMKNDTAPNYLPVTRYQNRAGLDDLEYVGEKGEALPGSVYDATKRQYQVYKWEKQFDFSMEALVNDDLGYLADTAAGMGRSARRTLEKYVSRMLWNATTIARLVGLGALYSTTGRLNTARISAARMAFSQRTDARGEPIAGSLRFIVYHTGLTDTIDVIRASAMVPEWNATYQPASAANVWRSGWTPIEDPFVAGVAPNLPWMALSAWNDNNLIPFVLLRRQGMPAPLLLRKKSDIESITSILGTGGAQPPILGDFASSNIVVKVWDEWGSYIDATEGSLFDFRGAYYSSGTVA